MNPETEQNINQAIDWLQKTGGQIQDFAVEQAPIYCREVVAWELWSNIAAGFGCLVFLGVLYLILRRTKGWIVNNLDEAHPGSIFLSLALAAGAIFASVNLCLACSRGIKAAVAPRLVIVEHLRSLK